MRKNRISETMGKIDQKYVNEATAYTGEAKAVRRTGWVKWGAAAACFCLVLVGMFAVFNESDHGMPGEIIVDREPIIVTIQEWKDEGFVCTVDDPDIHEFINQGYEVLVRFDNGTKVGGTDFKYDSENPNAPECGLSIGTRVELYFDAVDYRDDGMAHALGAAEIIPK